MHTVCDYLLLDYGLSKCVVSHTYILEHINTSKHRVTTSSVATVYACIYSTYIHTCVHAYTSCDYLLVATVYLCMYITHACIHACAHKSCDCLLVGYGLSTYMYHIHIYILHTYIHHTYIHTYTCKTIVLSIMKGALLCVGLFGKRDLAIPGAYWLLPPHIHM